MDDELRALRILQSAGYMKGVRTTASTLACSIPDSVRFRPRPDHAGSREHHDNDVYAIPLIPWMPSTSANARPQPTPRSKARAMSDVKTPRPPSSVKTSATTPPAPLRALQEKFMLVEPLAGDEQSVAIQKKLERLESRYAVLTSRPANNTQRVAYSPRSSKTRVAETSDTWIETWSKVSAARFNSPPGTANSDLSSSDRSYDEKTKKKKKEMLPVLPYAYPLLRPNREMRNIIHAKLLGAKKHQEPLPRGFVAQSFAPPKKGGGLKAATRHHIMSRGAMSRHSEKNNSTIPVGEQSVGDSGSSFLPDDDTEFV